VVIFGKMVFPKSCLLKPDFPKPNSTDARGLKLKFASVMCSSSVVLNETARPRRSTLAASVNKETSARHQIVVSPPQMVTCTLTRWACFRDALSKSRPSGPQRERTSRLPPVRVEATADAACWKQTMMGRPCQSGRLEALVVGSGQDVKSSQGT